MALLIAAPGKLAGIKAGFGPKAAKTSQGRPTPRRLRGMEEKVPVKALQQLQQNELTETRRKHTVLQVLKVRPKDWASKGQQRQEIAS